jgi:hypothetical protein
MVQRFKLKEAFNGRQKPLCSKNHEVRTKIQMKAGYLTDFLRLADVVSLLLAGCFWGTGFGWSCVFTASIVFKSDSFWICWLTDSESVWGFATAVLSLGFWSTWADAKQKAPNANAVNNIFFI